MHDVTNKETVSGHNVNNKETVSGHDIDNTETVDGHDADNKQTVSGHNIDNKQTVSGHDVDNRHYIHCGSPLQQAIEHTAKKVNNQNWLQFAIRYEESVRERTSLW